MRTLPLHIVSKGFVYNQVERRGNVAVYSQARKVDESKIIAYETIVIKSHDGYPLGDAYIEASEMYPNTESFGKIAWTYSTGLFKDAKQKALDRMGQVIEDIDIKAAIKARKAKTP